MDTVIKNIEIILADYLDPEQAQHIGILLNDYALDTMGGGKALAKDVIENLASTLATIPHAFTILAYVDNQPAGMINCFEGFSTFSCKSLINVHDVMVVADFRGLGLSHMMMEKVEEIARKRKCCKITLEVLEGNKIAQNLYSKQGFAAYELNPEIGKACFWEKTLKYA